MTEVYPGMEHMQAGIIITKTLDKVISESKLAPLAMPSLMSTAVHVCDWSFIGTLLLYIRPVLGNSYRKQGH